MIPKTRKVKRDIFPIFPQKGEVYSSPIINLKVFNNISPNNLNNKTKFSFIVSKKVAQKAVQRNLLKKRGYGVLRKILNKTKDNFICIFYFKKESQNTSFLVLEKEILNLLKKAKII